MAREFDIEDLAKPPTAVSAAEAPTTARRLAGSDAAVKEKDEDKPPLAQGGNESSQGAIVLEA